MNPYELFRPLLFALNPEAAHGLGLYALGVAQRSGFAHRIAPPPKDLPVRAFGIDFPNPVGLAAGLDKNAEHLDALGALGFGSIEVGTVTPRAQAGNPKPRLFRLPEHEAIINRMGFNNAGIDALVRNVEQSRYDGVLGINIGKNRDTPNEQAVNDYLHGLRRAYGLASYITVNISSPNTKGLRDLQKDTQLEAFIGRLREEQELLGSQHDARKPMLLKIAPDLDDKELDAMAAVLEKSGIDGVICTNTTLDRSGVQGAPHADEAGGLSGRPLRAAADRVLQGMRARLPERIPLIGVGGILDGDAAAGKISAGAALVQIYSGMIYRGPGLLGECVEEIRRQHHADTE
ncbi:quinone-dependent dihydroorotate dehydrogenase [Oleiagrimonas sp. MCCC 1A03011]|uniref:quinone-dependent dihydroorotate dehydrogenase n=1 Tax=Oleiagrimonas sp. MCCC 1A03011 TaxID=1926883 RepID=UPI000DC2EF5C|nr:quinone-dependent dihydroorotate dehydrogenase [Oleiagrimonas sp. MCCC 1A03011]RAP57638.1 dihydroorotate dehydrogenase (quinone) [Oleiagrimonas sp. MCCC 1A03011]